MGSRIYIKGLAPDTVALALPYGFKGDGTKVGVIGTHGAGSWYHQWLSPPGSQTVAIGPFNVFRECLRRGIPFITTDAGGVNTFGNDTALTSVTNAFNHLVAQGCHPSRVMLAGVSMGNLVNMSWARANLSKVAAILGMIPAMNITAAHAENRGGYTASINAAYGGAYSEAVYGATHNPATFKAQLAGIPFKAFYSTNDTQVLPAEVLDVVAGIGASASAVPMGAVGHLSDAVDAQAAVDFLEAHAA